MPGCGILYTPTSTAGGTSAYAGYAPPAGYAAGGTFASNPYPSTSSLMGGTVFEDEPPLLEGGVIQSLH
eukprot:1160558-Pelagomonas_calceolata.AAC.12